MSDYLNKTMYWNICIFIVISVFRQYSSSPENILLYKPVYANDYREYASNSNDGKKDSGMWLRSNNVMYIVFDMKKVYDIKRVKISNGNYRSKVPFSIYVGDEMKICHFHRQIKSYKICKQNVLQNETQLSIDCDNSSAQGRYLAIIKGEFLKVKMVEELNFYEIEAYGEFVNDILPLRQPKLQSQPVPKVTKQDFPLVNVLRKNLPAMTVPSYTKGFVKINEKCEPIIWDSKWNLTFALACYTDNNKGKALFFGKEWYFWYIMNDADKTLIRKAFVDWLSPSNNNPKFVNSKDFQTASDVRSSLSDGDILDFYTYVEHSNEVLAEIKSLLFEGKISLVFDHNGYDAVDDKVLNSMNEILDLFNVAIDSTYFTFSSGGDYTVNDKDFTDELLDLKTRLEKLVKNEDYLMEYSPSILSLYGKLPLNIIEKANLNNISQKFLEKYSSLVEYICPCKDEPVKNAVDKAIITMYATFAKSQILADSNFKVPCIDLFPGDFQKTPKSENVHLEVRGEIALTRIPIGYYLPAGKTASYKIKSSEGQWGISIGCHSDILSENRPEWYRYPNVYTNNILLSKEGKIFSPFGGVLWLINHNANSSITLSLSNVIATPFFNIHDEKAISDWNEKQRYNPGLWAQIAGEDMVICENSEKVKDFDGKYLKTLMESWDRIVRNNYVLSGKDWKKFRPSQTVLDIMTAAGYAHSGYPVCVFDDWTVSIFDYKYIMTEGSWGMCHELGHNMQDGTLWTWPTVVESTNNIFCLFNTAKEWKLPYYGSSKEVLGSHFNEIVDYLNDGAQYSTWKKGAYLQLGIYAQMANHFGFGFYKNVFYYYENQPGLKADSENEKLDLWANVTSTITGQNLMPIFDLWNLPVGNNMRQYLEKFPCFLPDDFMVKSSETREKFILNKYPNCHRKSKYNEDFNPESHTKGHRRNFIKKVN